MMIAPFARQAGSHTLYIREKKRGISFFQKMRSVESKMHKFLLTVHA